MDKKYLKYTSVLIFLFILLPRSYAAEPCRIVYGLLDKYKPYEWFDERGNAVGMNIDLLDAVCRNAGCSYEITFGSWSEMLAKLENGSITMMSVSPTSVTDNFAIYLAHSVVMYRYAFTRVDSPHIRDIQDLKDKTVFVIDGSYSDDYLTNSLPADMEVDVVGFPSHYDAVEALSKGSGDVFISTMVAGLNAVSAGGFDNIRSTGFPILPSIYGFTLHESNAELFGRLDKAMDELKKSGEYFEILKKWSSGSADNEWVRYLIVGALSCAGLVLAVLIWNKSLYLQVRRKTAILNEEIRLKMKTEIELIDSSNQLKKLSDLLSMLLDAVPENIYLLDICAAVLWSNKNLGDAFNPELLKSKIKQAINDSESFSIDQIPEGSKIWRISGIVLKNDKGLLLLVASDISETVKLRDEALISGRLAALGEMATNVAHEINNPAGLIEHNMDFIKRTLEYLFDALPDDGKLNLLRPEIIDAEDIIFDSLIRIRDTINDLKEYGKSRPGGNYSVDIRECLDTAVKMSGFFIKKYTNKFSVKSEGASFITFGNPMHIEQIILNLIQNACFALRGKDDSISCALSVTPGGEYIKLEVADTGCGMTDEVVENACKAFFTTRRDEGGTGLGLSIVSRIVREHNGRMTIESRYGLGTVVTLLFPVSKGGEGI